ncbi:MAG: hypothetical protein Kow0069_17590 [Promethearchaeota archaeon]
MPTDRTRLVEDVVQRLDEYWTREFPLERFTYPKQGKKINDPIYQTIQVEPPIRFLLDLPVVQRLRWIRHLGLTSMVYPTAVHTRFDHSVGVYHVLTRFLDQFVKSRHAENGPNDPLHDFGENSLSEDLQLHLKVAAILHDVGHLPFSHCVESSFDSVDYPEMGSDLFPTASVHEYFGLKLLDTTYIRTALEVVGDNEGVELDVRFLRKCVAGDSKGVSPDRRWAVQLINGDLDADKTDYLVRDSHFTGVPYGNVDLSRLLLMFRVKRDGDSLELFGNVRGLTAFESLFLSRLFMYSTVYHHHAKVAAETFLSRVVRSYFRFNDAEPEELLAWTDFRLCARLESDERVGPHFLRLKARRLPKVLLSVDAREIKKKNWIREAKDLALERAIAERFYEEGLWEAEGGFDSVPLPPVLVHFSEPHAAAPRFRFFLPGGEPALVRELSNVIKKGTVLQRLGQAFSTDPSRASKKTAKLVEEVLDSELRA